MQDIIFGVNPILEALISGKRSFNKILVAKGARENRLGRILRLAREKSVPVYYVDKKQLDDLVHKVKHQGIIAKIAPIDYSSPDEFINSIKLKGNQGVICLLDEIADPHNLGAIIRSAEVLGIDGIVITKRNSCPITATVEKTSAGAIEYIPIVRVDNLVNFIEKLKKENFWVVGADIKGDICYETNLAGPLAMVIGSESKGLRHLVQQKCDFLIKIPMAGPGPISSLNASCAASILMYEIYRQRKFVDKR